MERHSARRIDSMELTIAICRLRDAIEANLRLVRMNMRRDAITRLVYLGPGRVAAYHEKLLVRGAAERSPDGTADDEAIINFNPLQSCCSGEGAKRVGEVGARPCLHVWRRQWGSGVVEIRHGYWRDVHASQDVVRGP